ncbi:uncharacterized protein LOC143448627 isoform X2 [Clavelina lepadiformis]|uniref:uncharacterized protein LOC143448627 isoform X2 n=1 Tax=Clavelina lepadiformis TaxID=159417 RepID=UPI004042B235
MFSRSKKKSKRPVITRESIRHITSPKNISSLGTDLPLPPPPPRVSIESSGSATTESGNLLSSESTVLGQNRSERISKCLLAIIEKRKDESFQLNEENLEIITEHPDVADNSIAIISIFDRSRREFETLYNFFNFESSTEKIKRPVEEKCSLHEFSFSESPEYGTGLEPVVWFWKKFCVVKEPDGRKMVVLVMETEEDDFGNDLDLSVFNCSLTSLQLFVYEEWHVGQSQTTNALRKWMQAYEKSSKSVSLSEMFHMLTEGTYTIYECSCQVMDYLGSPEDNSDDDTFWENFQQALDGLRRGFDQDIWYHLFEKCSAMELGNKILTGKHLMELTKFLFEFLRKKTLHSGSAKKILSCQQQYTTVIKNYMDKMDPTKQNLTSSELKSKHEQEKSGILEKFSTSLEILLLHCPALADELVEGLEVEVDRNYLELEQKRFSLEIEIRRNLENQVSKSFKSYKQNWEEDSESARNSECARNNANEHFKKIGANISLVAEYNGKLEAKMKKFDESKAQQMKALMTKIQSLDKELADCTKKVLDLEDKNKAKDEQLINFNEEVIQRNRKIKQLEDENQQITEELSQTKAENQNLKDEISQMKQDEKNKILISTFIPSDKIFAVKGEEGFLGRGGFGCVRLGFTDPHGPVAIKCITVVGSRDSIKQTHDRIMEEIRHTKLSSNINVVRVEGYTHWPGAAAIVVEYMPGGDLHTFLTGRGRHGYEIPSIPAVIRLRFCADVTSGITFLHFGFFSDQRLTHGDLKSQNVLLTTDLRCKVSDFGGASFATSTNADPALGNQRSEFTAVYASPERLLNPGLRTSKKMDVYSTSMIIHEVVTRKPPFDVRMSRQDLISHVAHLGNRPSLEGVEELKQSLNDEEDVNIISLMQEEMVRCWSQHPEDRPSIMEVRDKFVGALLRKDQSIIAQHVADITKRIKIKIPDRREFVEKCAPIGQFTSHDIYA